MKTEAPDFLQNAENVYRTKDYIVKQRISVLYSADECNGVISHDTFYKRTQLRDAEYELAFNRRKKINGRRLPSTMYARVYVN